MNSIRHSRESGNPEKRPRAKGLWIPACAGMTETGYLSSSIFLTAWNSPPACKR